jgi:hypothetical protein
VTVAVALVLLDIVGDAALVLVVVRVFVLVSLPVAENVDDPV